MDKEVVDALVVLLRRREKQLEISSEHLDPHSVYLAFKASSSLRQIANDQEVAAALAQLRQEQKP